jgi:hypothetical protein
VPGSNPQCFCDSACSDPAYDDCCADKERYCPTPPRDPTCKKYCCAASDCGAGETCAAIAASLGTIGVCQARTRIDAGAGGSPTIDSGASDTGAGGAPAADGGPLALPPGCVIATPPCNPVTNAACATDQACDLTTGGGFQCFDPPNEAQPGGDCKSDGRPHCIGGYHCSQ